MIFKNLFHLVLILSATWVLGTHGKNILFIYPLSTKSMANVFDPIVYGLFEKGHNVTVVSPEKFRLKSIENDTHQSSKFHQIVIMTGAEIVDKYPDPFVIRKKNKMFQFSIPFITNGCNMVYQNKEFMQLLEQKFDLIYLNILFNDCFAGFIHKLGSPVILLSPVPVPSPMMELFGNYQPSSYIPVFLLGDFGENPTFFQRTKSFLYNLHFYVMHQHWTLPVTETIYRKYLGEDVPSVNDIYKKQVSMIFVNAHHAITRPRPNLPSVVEIGGIHCQPAKPLPQDLEDFVSGAEDGFILFSLGTIVAPSNMPESVMLAFMNTFGKLKQRVIWKWDKDEGIPEAPDNVKIVKWLPQQDLLGHQNIRLFITQGGLLSIEESIYHSVPVLGLPVFVDQDNNMNQAEILGFGVKEEIFDLTQVKLDKLISKVLNEPRFMQKAKELSDIFRDQPQTALERAVYWSEYVIHHKGAYHLQSAAKNMSLIQFHSVDIVLFLITSIVFILPLIWVGSKQIFYMIMHLHQHQGKLIKCKKQ